MATIIKDEKLTRMAESVKPDTKRRVLLPKSVVKGDVTYHIYANSLGQIILDPQVTIPASEVWVFKHKEVLAAIDKGMAEAADGKAVKRGSFARHVKDAS
ncbi:MAG: hypothetical protein PHR56_02105 [Dehalococcoidales bacterium]|nr:hypothetical protein [Dehalococcoidales bacterium]